MIKGRMKISETDSRGQRMNFSKRFNKSICMIKRKHCLSCGHDKVFDKPRGIYCTKCKIKNG